MSTVGSSSVTPEGSSPGFDLCLVTGDTATEVDRAESFLIARGFAARLDQASGITSILLTDASFRPLRWDTALAAEFAATLGRRVRLVVGSGPAVGSPAGHDESDPGIDSVDRHAASWIDPDGSASVITDTELRQTIADIPDRASGDDRWLVVGHAPGSSPGRLAELARAALPEGAVQALVWVDQGWFVAAITCARTSGDPSNDPQDCQSLRPAAAAALATEARAGRKRAVMVIRHSSVDTVVMQPGARDWAEYPLEWGLRRTWVHPRWGVAVVDQDRAVSQFAKAWAHAGGVADEVNLRALSRRRALKGEVLSPLLASLSVPPGVAELVVTLALSDASQPAPPPAPQVIAGDPERAARRWGLGRPGVGGLRARRWRGASARAVHAVGAFAGLALGYGIVSQGVAGWDWAALAAIGLAALAGSANLAATPIRVRLGKSGKPETMDGRSSGPSVAALPGEAEPR